MIQEALERGDDPIFIEGIEFHDSRPRHWGVWHPTRGWAWAVGMVFATPSRAVAEAQLTVVRDSWRGLASADGEWQVRCIEEWYEEGQDEQSG